MTALEIISLKYKELFHSSAAEEGKKRVTPRNEGISSDVYENKRQRKSRLGCLEMSLKNKHVTRISGDVHENRGVMC